MRSATASGSTRARGRRSSGRCSRRIGSWVATRGRAAGNEDRATQDGRRGELPSRERTASVFGVTGAGARISRADRTSRNNEEKLDQLSRHIKARLDALLSEADKLRHALTALGSRDEYPKRSEASRSSASPTRSSRRAEGAETPTASSSRQRSGARTKKPARASSSRQREPRDGRSAGPAGNATRSAPGATKRAVLQTLSAGEAMTAGRSLPRPGSVARRSAPRSRAWPRAGN